MPPKKTDSNPAADDLLQESLKNQRKQLAEMRDRANSAILLTMRQETAFRDRVDANARTRPASLFVQPRLLWAGAASTACALLIFVSAFVFGGPTVPTLEPLAERVEHSISDDVVVTQLMLLPPESATAIVNVHSGAMLLVPSGTMIRPAQGSVRIETPLQIRVSGA